MYFKYKGKREMFGIYEIELLRKINSYYGNGENKLNVL